MRLAKRRKVRPDDPVAVVTRFLDAANHHDADGLRACVHPEFESFQPLHPARNFRGAGQLISNWRAIFEAEPGFRLTLLRASTTGNTVWAEVHGAGASAEAAGIFIVGVEEARIRWIRVYSDLVEPLPEEPAEDAPAADAPAIDWDRDPIRLVPPRPPEAAEGEAAEGAPEEPGEPEVAVAGGDPPSLRLVDSEPAEEAPETTTAGEALQAPEAPEAPEATATTAVAADAEAIEVLVGDASEVEVEVQTPPPAPFETAAEASTEAGAAEVSSEAGLGGLDAKAPAEEDVAEAPSDGDGQEDDDEEALGLAPLDTVARFGGAAPEPSGDDGASGRRSGRRRRSFLRRGGAR